MLAPAAAQTVPPERRPVVATTLPLLFACGKGASGIVEHKRASRGVI